MQRFLRHQLYSETSMMSDQFWLWWTLLGGKIIRFFFFLTWTLNFQFQSDGSDRPVYKDVSVVTVCRGREFVEEAQRGKWQLTATDKERVFLAAPHRETRAVSLPARAGRRSSSSLIHGELKAAFYGSTFFCRLLTCPIFLLLDAFQRETHLGLKKNSSCS